MYIIKFIIQKGSIANTGPVSVIIRCCIKYVHIVFVFSGSLGDNI